MEWIRHYVRNIVWINLRNSLNKLNLAIRTCSSLRKLVNRTAFQFIRVHTRVTKKMKLHTLKYDDIVNNRIFFTCYTHSRNRFCHVRTQSNRKWCIMLLRLATLHIIVVMTSYICACKYAVCTQAVLSYHDH